MIDDIKEMMLSSVDEKYYTGEGSVFDTVFSALAERLDALNDKISAVKDSTHAITAVGEDLDEIAERRYLYRLPAEYAEGEVQFTGKAGEVIPAGSRVASATQLYRTVEDVSLTDGGVAIAKITALVSGSAANCGIGEIDRLPASIPNVSAVTNLTAVTGGRDAESDAELLERYQAECSAPPTSGNLEHYRYWALEFGADIVRTIKDEDNAISVYAYTDDLEGLKSYVDEHKPIGAGDINVLEISDLSVNISMQCASAGNVHLAYIEDIKAYANKLLDELNDAAEGTVLKSYVEMKVNAYVLAMDGVTSCSVTSNLTDSVQIDKWLILGEVKFV